MRLQELLFEGIDSKIDHLAKSMGKKIAEAAFHDHSAADIIMHFQGRKYDTMGDAEVQTVLASQILRKLSQADPTGERADALVWIARMYAAREFLLEDVGRLMADLTKFFQYRRKLPNRDLNSYKSLNELYDAIESVEGEDPASKRQQAKTAKVEGSRKIISSQRMTIVQLLTQEAANYYGKGTKWCTTSEHGEHFDQYASQGPLYVLIIHDGATQRKFQFHYESNQFMNERDQPVGGKEKALLSQYEEYVQFLNMMIERHYGKYFDRGE